MHRRILAPLVAAQRVWCSAHAHAHGSSSSTIRTTHAHRSLVADGSPRRTSSKAWVRKLHGGLASAAHAGGGTVHARDNLRHALAASSHHLRRMARMRGRAEDSQPPTHTRSVMNVPSLASLDHDHHDQHKRNNNNNTTLQDEMPTATSRKEVRMLGELQHWIYSAAINVAAHVFDEYRDAIRDALLAPYITCNNNAKTQQLFFSSTHNNNNNNKMMKEEHTTTPATSSLMRRGAKSFVELLQHHQREPRGAAEWRRVCAALLVEGDVVVAEANVVVLALPLVPQHTTTRRRSGVDEGAAAAFIRNTASWKELVCVLRWCRRWPTTTTTSSSSSSEGAVVAPTHISSRDIAYILNKYIQAEGERGEDVDADDDDDVVHECNMSGSFTDMNLVAELVEAWQRSRAAEQRCAALAAHCGLHHRTQHNTIHLTGKRLASSSSSSTPPTASSDEAYAGLDELLHAHELLVLGKLDAVEHLIDGVARRHVGDATPTTTSSSSSCSGGVSSSVALLFSPAHVHTLVKVFFRGNTLTMPAELRMDAMRAEELEMLQRPPSHGLAVVVADTSSSSSSCRSTHDWMPSSVPCELIQGWMSAEVRGGRSPTSPSSLVVELRRRLWLLRHVPPHISAMLVRVDAAPVRVSSTMMAHDVDDASSSPNSVQRHRRGARRPYLLRSPAKELLPWLLLTAMGRAMQRMAPTWHNNNNNTWMEDDVELQHLRTLMRPALFSPSWHYASHHEYVMDQLVAMGINLVEVVGGGSCLAHTCYTDMVCFMLEPPPPSFYTELDQPQQRQHDDIDDHHEEDDVVGGGALSPYIISAQHWHQLRTIMAQLSNYHASLHVEGVARVGALPRLLAAISSTTIIYAPESAAAIATTLVLQLLPSWMTLLDDDVLLLQRVEEMLAGHGLRGTRLVFAVSAEKHDAAKSYLGPIYDASFVEEVVMKKNTTTTTTTTHDDDDDVPHKELKSCVCSATRGWMGTEALLVGRSLRPLHRYPAAAAQVFMRVRPRDRHSPHTSCVFSPPKLRMKCLSIHIPRMLAFFCRHAQRTKLLHHSYGMKKKGNDDDDHHPVGVEDALVLSGHGQLPHGMLAVMKPAGVNATLHAQYPSLAILLHLLAPWRGWRSGGTHANNNNKKMNELCPVLHQHGLVNRIDVGTSGIVLVADNHDDLHTARAASLVRHVMTKRYRALVQHFPPAAQHTAAEAVYYLPNRGVMSSPVEAHASASSSSSSLVLKSAHAHQRDRRPAHTVFRVLEYFPRHGIYHVEVELRSGRRHQIRQHFAQMHHPLVGDVQYQPREMTNQPNNNNNNNNNSWGLTRPALHAMAVDVGPTTSTEERVVVECEMPNDMRRALERLRQSL